MAEDINNTDNTSELETKITNLEKTINELTENIELMHEYKNIKEDILKIKDKLKNTKNFYNKIESVYNKVEELNNKIETIYNDFINKDQSITTKYNEQLEHLATINTTIANAEQSLKNITTINTNCTSLHDKIAETESAITSFHTKVQQTYNTSVSYKNKIKDLYDEIYGYDEEDEEGNTQTIPGLKDQLEESYNTLENNSKNLTIQINNTNKKVIEDTQAQINKFLEAQKREYDSLLTKINGLLPSALTAGLAHAYIEKREAEEKTLKKSNIFFMFSICAAICAALIPFGISYQILQTVTLQETISYIPKLMTFLIPVYIPIIWIATHFNKQIKLSKRLIEEYTHKEVLNKTFEGLAKQIEQLDDSTENYEDLRAKLLYNIIEMTSHNPGQLIKGFEHTDHPLIEVLNKIMQSEESLDKLQNIPGISVVINKLQARINKKKQNTNQEITELVQEDLEDKIDK